MTSESPFLPGVRVAVQTSHVMVKYREAFVDKVYKTGRFTLRNTAEITTETIRDRQQWSPSEAPIRDAKWQIVGFNWQARETGDHHHIRFLYVWNTQIDAEIEEVKAKRDLYSRVGLLRERIRIVDLTLDQIKAIEAILDEGEKHEKKHEI